MSLPYVIEAMTPADLDEVLAIERASFRFPWPERAFLGELALPYTVYRVVRLAAEPGRPAEVLPRRRWWRIRPAESRGAIVGYGGMQIILDEAHLMTLATHPDYRRRGIAELLLQHLIDEARFRGARRMTLEVRVSNLAAQSLYRKYGFTVEGRRLRYYGDGEDALIMWTGRLDTEEGRSRLAQLRERLGQRLAAREEVGDPDPGA